LTNVDMLDKAISSKGIKIGFLCDKLGLSSPSLTRRLQGKTEFKASEIAAMRDVLSLSDKDVRLIFLS